MTSVEFDSMNETDVREIIVRPLLDRLGYRHGTAAAIRTEVSLRYGRAFLGRKKPSKDPTLSGRADYICDFVPFGRWVIEVKAPNEEITQDVVEQAHTYAAHPEVSAAYFLVTNGREWQLFETSKLEVPVLSWIYADTGDKFLSLFNIVSPEALRARSRLLATDKGKPLGKGLASRLEIIGGEVLYEDHFTDHPLLRMADVNGLRLPVTEGFVDRDEEGKILARVRIASAIPMMRELHQALGYEGRADFFAIDEYVSTDVICPTIFKSFWAGMLPPGVPINIPGVGRQPSLFGVQFQTITDVVGYFDGSHFRGTIQMTYDFSFEMPPSVIQALEARLGDVPVEGHMTGGGTFEIRAQPAR